MPDVLHEMFLEWRQKQNDPVEFAIYQAGFTTAAVSMRTRAMDCCNNQKDVNKIKNAIGALSDIP